jgi:ethanolamine utilization protein EutA (predicted chaperonin)
MHAPIRGGFSSHGRSMALEDHVTLVSVGVDIGSSTTHLLFSRLELERVDSRYVTTGREVLHSSDVRLTPYLDDTTIDDRALGEFIAAQYAAAGVGRSDVDTGALILTGVALDRRNARAVADLFAAEAGRFVAVSAGDNLEAALAANGSGAVALSERGGGPVLNIDIGGGTTKVAVCRDGAVEGVMAIDVGARLVAYDDEARVTRIEPAALRFADRVGVELRRGHRIGLDELRALAREMVSVLLSPLRGDRSGGGQSFLRTAALPVPGDLTAVTFSGGTAEYLHDRARKSFGDLGPYLADAIWERAHELPAPVVETGGGLRATVIGASQHTVQVSGSTVCVSPPGVVPVRNVPVVRPQFDWPETIDPAAVGTAVRESLDRFDLGGAATPVAVVPRWEGPASYARIEAFATGLVIGLGGHIAAGHPVILVFAGDIGGLVGLHLVEEAGLGVGVISVDGVDLREFDYVDIGELIPASGAVPLVIKSLVFSPGESEHCEQRSVP